MALQRSHETRIPFDQQCDVQTIAITERSFVAKKKRNNRQPALTYVSGLQRACGKKTAVHHANWVVTLNKVWC